MIYIRNNNDSSVKAAIRLKKTSEVSFFEELHTTNSKYMTKERINEFSLKSSIH